ncbi:ABC transporter substrate-binding protein [Halosimplex salinum]|uniref:ABC transporter substrate-binding protein n=1 Tax=Halosimplex salinum TaxID=1710538 RepID=UPI000F49A140|nr:ABC transporter substrate-binding protein [Halosimplex salinum]
MTDDSPSETTRRAYLTTSAALFGGGLLAGCTSDSGSTDTPESAATDAPTETPTDAPTDAATDTPAGTQSTPDTPYSVSMEPVGEVTFDSVPETWVANNGSWADMGVALGLQPPEAVWLTGRYHTQYYDDIPGVSVDKSDMVSLYQGEVDKELFHELDADIHVVDPNFLMNRFKGWEQSDVDEVAESAGPFFGNSIFSTGYGWHEDYQYYSLYEAFEKLAAAFQERERYEAFEAVHEEFQSEVSSVVPENESDRPAVAIMWAGGDEPEEFSPYLIGEGTSFKQWRDLGVRDALAETDVQDFHSDRSRIDFETLLEIDPEIVLFRGQEAKTRSEFEDTVVSHLEDHQTASALTAVQNDDVYRGGGLYQGPITNMVLTERGASQVYGVDVDLFDRERVAEIVNGDL